MRQKYLLATVAVISVGFTALWFSVLRPPSDYALTGIPEIAYALETVVDNNVFCLDETKPYKNRWPFCKLSKSLIEKFATDEVRKEFDPVIAAANYWLLPDEYRADADRIHVAIVEIEKHRDVILATPKTTNELLARMVKISKK